MLNEDMVVDLLDPTSRPAPSHLQAPAPAPSPPASNILGVVAGVERGLQDARREDNFILGWKVVGIHCLGSHAPPRGGRGRGRGC